MTSFPSPSPEWSSFTFPPLLELPACRRQQVRFPKVCKRWHLIWVYLGPKQEGLRAFRPTLLDAASCHPTVVLPLSQGSNDPPPIYLLAWAAICRTSTPWCLGSELLAHGFASLNPKILSQLQLAWFLCTCYLAVSQSIFRCGSPRCLTSSHCTLGQAGDRCNQS